MTKEEYLQKLAELTSEYDNENNTITGLYADMEDQSVTPTVSEQYEYRPDNNNPAMRVTEFSIKFWYDEEN